MAPSHTEITIREFESGDDAAFRRLNEEWILRYFAMEPKDEEILADPCGKILSRGGRIFFAVHRGEAVGCCALLAARPGELELAKMAVTEKSRGNGVGRLLLARALEAARAAGATRVFLETNRQLAPAIALYESVGFRHIPAERRAPSPYARADVFMEILLDPTGEPRH